MLTDRGICRLQRKLSDLKPSNQRTSDTLRLELPDMVIRVDSSRAILCVR